MIIPIKGGKMGKNKVLIFGLVVGLFTSLIFVSSCVQTEEGSTFDWTIIAFLVAIFAIFYFLMIRPQRKRQKEHQHMMDELKRGDRVVTAGGIYGVVESLSEDSIVMKVESGTTMRVARNSVAIKQEK
jgi:preprotein translocase subunit YajC